ncbi:MAG: hypothetical protein ACE5NW_18530, partial [Acidiferrobacterales bacterium]
MSALESEQLMKPANPLSSALRVRLFDVSVVRSRTIMGGFLFWLILYVGPTSLAFADLPVIPNGAGFGITTPAGRGGKVYKVTNLRATGRGSLKACIDRSGPRVCVFEVSGTITLTRNLWIANPFITIAGQTAPSPGITIRGAALGIETHDVLVQHLRIRVGDDPNGPDPENRDAIRVEDKWGIVIDHCSLSWAIDETISAWTDWDNVT